MVSLSRISHEDLQVKSITRLDQELDAVHRWAFDDYFLLSGFGCTLAAVKVITWDGRGSAVGSLVAYALEITGIDPAEKNLLFERFLNLERYTMPDTLIF